jgi:heterodisulfide reductase subunit A
MAIARARRLHPLENGTLQVNQTGLVIGGGLTGMTAALALADQGFKVQLIEKTDRLGGTLRDIDRTLEHVNIGEFAESLENKVKKHPNITLYLGAEITAIAGHVGKFLIKVAQNGKTSEVAGGTVIVATGARKAETTDFLYGRSKDVLTQSELEKRLHEDQ